MGRSSIISNKVKREFSKKNTLTLDELYQTLSKDTALEYVMPHLKHRIRSCLYALKKQGIIELVDKATYQLR